MQEGIERLGKLELTEEEKDLIFKGIRPSEMPQDVFKQVRAQMTTRTKKYLQGGNMVWNSAHWVKMSEEELERQEKEKKFEGEIPTVQNKGAGTYIRSTPRRHKELGRK